MQSATISSELAAGQDPRLRHRVREIVVRERLPALVALFFLSAITPVFVEVAGLRISVYRLALILAFLPCLFWLVTGKAGKLIIADYAIALWSVWVALSYVALHGWGQTWQIIGFTGLEVMGSYMLARCFIRTPEMFLRTVQILLIYAFVMLPLSLYESLTEHNIALELWSKVGSVYPDLLMEPRLGFGRAQVVFEHPIHLGVFAASLIGLGAFVAGYRKPVSWKFMVVLSMGLCTFLTMSSGPFSAVIAQAGLIVWNALLGRMKGRWWLLLVLTVIAYVVVDMLSNRKPLEVLIGYLAFNAETGYGRIQIWYYGWVNMFENPVWGIGLNDWKREHYMTPSFDMFWLYYGMVNGMVAGLCQMFSFLTIFVALIFRPITDPMLNSYRLGWLFSMFGLFMAGWMVHYWNVPLVHYLFLLGAGVWMLQYVPEEAAAQTVETERPQPASRYTRFPAKQRV
jgi:hypothetical protein